MRLLGSSASPFNAVSKRKQSEDQRKDMRRVVIVCLSLVRPADQGSTLYASFSIRPSCLCAGDCTRFGVSRGAVLRNAGHPRWIPADKSAPRHIVAPSTLQCVDRPSQAQRSAKKTQLYALAPCLLYCSARNTARSLNADPYNCNPFIAGHRGAR